MESGRRAEFDTYDASNDATRITAQRLGPVLKARLGRRWVRWRGLAGVVAEVGVRV